jgi:predicted ATPase
MLSASAQEGLEKYVQREGGMEPLVWDGSASSIEFIVELERLGGADDDVQTRSRYTLELTRLGKASSYQIGHESLYDFGPSQSKWLDRSPGRSVFFDEEQAESEVHEIGEEVETLLSMAGGHFSPNRAIFDVSQNFASWAVYQDLRTDRDAPIRLPSITTLAKRVAPDGQNLVSVLHTLYTSDRDFKREINVAMTAAFGNEFEELIFPPASDQRVQLRVRWKSLKREQSAADLSDGTLRFLFLLAVLGSPSPAPLIAIDEPETGLHPSMLPIVAEYAAAAATRTQVILTTHSPAFLDAFREMIPTITVVNWSEGRTQLQVLSGEQLGYWLKQYTLGEIYRTGELEAMR